jgi:hypothetical protein
MYSMDSDVQDSVSNISSLGISECIIYQIERVTKVLKSKYNTFRPSFVDYYIPVHI